MIFNATTLKPLLGRLAEEEKVAEFVVAEWRFADASAEDAEVATFVAEIDFLGKWWFSDAVAEEVEVDFTAEIDLF